MDTKEQKKLLKNAREAIKNKEFKDALKHCKSILSVDKENYNAMVFIGVAAEGLEQPEQALTAYKRAIDLAPDQILAWQGLSSFYEKSEKKSHKKELIPVYEKLIGLNENDINKQVEILKKLAAAQRKEGFNDEALISHKKICDLAVDFSDKEGSYRQVVRLIEGKSGLSDEESLILENAYKFVINDQATIDEEQAELWVNYIKYLIRTRSSDAESVAKKCHSIHPNSLYPLEILVLVRLDESVKIMFGHEDLDDLSDKIQVLDPESYVLNFITGFKQFLDGKFSEAVESLNKALEKKARFVSGWLLLGKACLALHDHPAVDQAITSGLKYAKSKKTIPIYFGELNEVENELNFCLAQSLLDEGSSFSTSKALNLVESLKQNEKVLILKAQCYIQNSKVDEALDVITILDDCIETKFLKGLCNFMQENWQEALNNLQAVFNESGKSIHCFWVGRAYFELSKAGNAKKELALEHMIKAAKLDPYYSETYYYLGCYYAHFEKNSEKAKKCYTKSYTLKPTSDLAGIALVDILIESGEDDKTVNILETVTSKASAGQGKWAWFRLGLYQLKIDDTVSALASMQCALRADPNDCHVWECLGEVYMSRGSYTAAMKAFQRAAELDINSLYSLYQIASIKQTLGSYTEAKEEYELLLEKSSDYIPALKGLAETHLQLAKKALGQFFHGHAVGHSQKAIEILVQAVTMRPDLSCLWKGIGDACTLTSPIPADLCIIEVPAKLLKRSSTSDLCTIKKQDLLSLGARCYGQALKILPNCGNLWHDLGVNYYHQVKNFPESDKELQLKSIQCLQKAVNLNSGNYKHWLALGTVSADSIQSNPSLAQHCFIKSIQLEQNNVVAWTNLAALYLKHGNVELAHEAFKKAQSLEPSYVGCWIGQSIIAETVGHEDAMDLFRHATGLSNHIEGFIGYGHWVCSALKGITKLSPDLYDYCINQMYAVLTASDAMIKYNSRIHGDPTACNTSGILLEWQQLYSSACSAFKSAASEATDSDTKTKAKTNLARVLCKLGQYSDSVALWESLSPDNLDTVCSFALACYKSGDFDRSIALFSKALDLAETNADKCHLFAAIGKISFAQGDLDSTKTALFQSTQSDEPSLHGLEALCCLGLLLSDPTLTLAVLQEVQKQTDTKHSCMFAHLISNLYLLAGEPSSAVESLKRLSRSLPNDAKLISTVCEILSEISNEPEFVIELGSKACGLDGRYNPAPVIAKVLASCEKDRNKALRESQKLVHLFPGEQKNWQLFQDVLTKKLTMT